MALDLSKRHEGRLGRGRIPEEVKQRVREDEKQPPADRGFEEFRHRLREEFQQNWEDEQREKRGESPLRRRLQSQGGKWENPRSWKPRDPKRRRELDEHRGVT